MKQQRWILVVATLAMGVCSSCSVSVKGKPAAPLSREALELRQRVHEITDTIPLCQAYIRMVDCIFRAAGKFPESIYRTFLDSSGEPLFSTSAYRHRCAVLLVRTATRVRSKCVSLVSGVLDQATAVAQGPVPPDLPVSHGGSATSPGVAGGEDSGNGPTAGDASPSPGGDGDPPSPPSDSGGPPSPPSDSGGPPSPPSDSGDAASPQAGGGDDRCARGQVSVAGHCCWPGQDWGAGSQRCIGTPRCPSGTRTKGDTCVAGCPSGQVRVAGHCCWPGQDWGVGSQRCIGRPRCPRGTRRKGETCVR